ncbi:Aste57867_24724 [Aphanomyces stellatus]|uniref:Aste57867_24724 protein n=1 Tax=Aphanomyces stellatus TaxID=120398 RepID=A0A485LT97_9STRA|nr:hypothetical protein As57867_024646 [Aphanomyces stellatus]VFU01361.1 Aste57867_24724 [Aphanomyces stellatus]
MLLGRVLLSVIIYTAAGPVKVPGAVECHVTQDGDEFLVPDGTLKQIGIDISRLLEQVAEKQRLDEGDDIIPRSAMEVGFDMLEESEEEPLTSNMSDVHRLRRVGEDPDRVRDAMIADDTKGVELMMKQTVENGFPQDRRFFDAFAAILLEAGVIWKNDRRKYCSPVNPVLKPGGIHKRDVKSKEWSDEKLLQYFRLTIDYRVINSMKVPSAGAMPFQVEILEHVQGAVVLAVFDLIKGFWQMPLAEASRQVLSFMVNGKIMTPTRVMQGHVDCALYFQKTMENVCGSLLYHNLLAWIDDVLLFAKSIDDTWKSWRHSLA